jgi:hypothetical protein
MEKETKKILNEEAKNGLKETMKSLQLSNSDLSKVNGGERTSSKGGTNIGGGVSQNPTGCDSCAVCEHCIGSCSDCVSFKEW